MMPRVMVLVHCTSPQWDLSSFMLPCIVLKLCCGQKRDGRVDYYMLPFGGIKRFVSEIQIFKAPSMCNSMNAFEAVAQFSPGLLLCQTGRRKKLLLIMSKHYQLIPSGLVFAPWVEGRGLNQGPHLTKDAN